MNTACYPSASSIQPRIKYKVIYSNKRMLKQAIKVISELIKDKRAKEREVKRLQQYLEESKLVITLYEEADAISREEISSLRAELAKYKARDARRAESQRKYRAAKREERTRDLRKIMDMQEELNLLNLTELTVKERKGISKKVDEMANLIAQIHGPR